MGLSYDRRVPEELLKALEPGGFAHSLVEFGGSGMWALDPSRCAQSSHSTAEPLKARKRSWRQCARTWPPPVLQQTLT
jgi:hypothetical protein